MATQVKADQIWHFGVYEVDTRRVELRRYGTPIKLREQSFLILVYLLEHAGEIVTREELRRLLWPSDTFVDFDHSLNMAMKNLRDTLGDATEVPLFIETIPKRGYRFIAPIIRAEKEKRNGLAQPNGDSDSSLINGINGVRRSVSALAGTRVRRRLLALAVAFLALGLATAILYLHRPLPPLRVTEYTQITHDRHQKLLAGTDGNRLYFNRISNLEAPASIAQVAISGGEIAQIPLELPNPVLVDVSPDGSSFLIGSIPEVMKADLPLWNVRILGGSARRLGEVLNAAFSPDGNSMAYFTADGDNSFGIFIARGDGTGAHELASIRGEACSIRITPNCRIAWSPDGSTIRFDRDDKIYEIKADGSGLHEFLAGWRPSSSRCCGQWTPDGKFFLFLSGESVWDRGEMVLKGGAIWALNERRGMFRHQPVEPVQLTSGPVSWGRPIPGKDGSNIFAEGTILRGELSRFDPKSNQFQPFLGGISAQGVAFSKDGESIAYVSYPEGILWKANRDGSNPVQLSDPPIQALLPRWSPDGTQIVFSDSASSNGRTIYIVSSEGGSPRKLFPEDNGLQVMPFWSPDGHKIVFNWGPPSRDVDWANIRILDLDSGQVTTVPGSNDMIGPRWSLDGRHLVATRDELHLMIFDFKTQQWSELPQKGLVDSPEWSRDGKYIYFRRVMGDRGVFRIPIKGGEAEKIADLKDWHDAGWWGMYVGLDPTDAPLLLRDIGSDDIYALTLNQK